MHLVDSKKNILSADVLAEQVLPNLLNAFSNILLTLRPQLYIGRSAIQSSKENGVAISLLTTHNRTEWAALRKRFIDLNERNRWRNVDMIFSVLNLTQEKCGTD